MNRLNIDNARRLGNLLDSFVEYDEAALKVKLKTYMRIIVHMNVNAQLKYGIFIKEKSEIHCGWHSNMNAYLISVISVEG